MGEDANPGKDNIVPLEPSQKTTVSGPVPREQSGETTLNAPIWQRSYRLVRDLGEGGMGKVLLAERRSDSVLVCLKFLNTKTDPRMLEQECRALMRLRHPSIVSLLDFAPRQTLMAGDGVRRRDHASETLDGAYRSAVGNCGENPESVARWACLCPC